MITTRQYHHIADLIVSIANAEILSRFRTLSDSDIVEKNPGDLVTTADRRAEERLSQELERLIPGSVTVGEEGVAADPSLLDHLKTDTPAWIIDPVDGTSNFVAGERDYCCLVSLSTGDTTHASWVYAPSLGLTAGAHTGHGVWINGHEAALADRAGADTIEVVTTHPNYTAGYRAVIDKLAVPGVTTSPCRTAGLSYVDIVRGECDAVAYTWQHPWDHAAGLHILSAVGGVSATMDGVPFRLSGGNHLPFVAGTPDAVAVLARRLAT